MNQIWIFILNHFFCMSYIIFDAGDIDLILQQGYWEGQKLCESQYGTGTNITFNGIFANTPTIVAFPYYWYQQEERYTVDVSTDLVTSSGFRIKAYAAHNCIIQIKVRWLAIDDHRIDIIRTMLYYTMPQQTLNHNNINALKGFTTFYDTDQQGHPSRDFSIDIVSITAQNVTVSLKQSDPINNYMAVGVVIILYTPEAFEVSQKITKTLFRARDAEPENIIDSGILQTKPGYKFFLCFCDMQYDWGINLELYSGYIIETATTTQYKIKNGAQYAVIKSLGWYEVWFNMQNTKVLYPMILTKLRISKLINLQQGTHSIKVEITELNQTFTDVTNSQIAIIEKPIQTLNIIATLKCQQGKKITSFFAKSVQGTQQNQNVNQNCYGGMNQIALHATFYQDEQVNQKIQISITSTLVTISQIIFNQAIVTYDIMQVNYLDQ